ncbi:MAG: response regulator [Dehalococcoidia bacterium]|nr:response regulator [Dehalococcoidia bacterium]
MMAKILVVDDAPFMRMRASKLLSENGFQVIEAGNGAEAVKKYKDEKPDAVMMDITMPEMDGLQALKEMRKLDPNAKVCMVTAMGQQSIVLEAISAGAKDFVVKPFDANRVLATVQKMVS